MARLNAAGGVYNRLHSRCAIIIQPPQTPADAASQAVSVQSEKIADGVFYLKGGTHHSVAVEFADYSVVVEGPQNEQRSLAVIAEVKRLIPNKPIRYLVNTHHHFDHRGAAPAPPDPKQILEKGCTSCHDLNRVTSKNLSQAEWQGVVDQMKGRGAEVSDAETSILIDYLVKTYGHN